MIEFNIKYEYDDGTIKTASKSGHVSGTSKQDFFDFIDHVFGKEEPFIIPGFNGVISYEYDIVSFDDPLTEESIVDAMSLESTDDIKTEGEPNIQQIATAIDSSNNGDIPKETQVAEQFKGHLTWDPRLYRYDEYFEVQGGNGNTMRVPFGSNTIVSSFADISNVMELGVVEKLIDAQRIAADSAIGKLLNGESQAKITPETETDESSNVKEKTASSSPFDGINQSTKVITHDNTNVENDGKFWGVQSIVNPYSITKLVGGIDKSGGQSINYMYDIRDHRRFYSQQDSGDVLSVSNPTVTQLIDWSNKDQWGRTPYSFQDFVYCKFFGLIPNNRLITFRRYAVPTYDNLQFPNMYGSSESKTKDSSGNTSTETIYELTDNNTARKTFSPKAYVVTWFGGDTGNSLNNLMSFSTGIKWDKLDANIWTVDGDSGETKQAVIDKLLGDGAHTGGYGKAELDSLTSLMQGASMVSAKITSFGKFFLALKGDIGMSQDAYERYRGANVDPFENTFKNRAKGPLDRVDSVMKRSEGIEFQQTLTIKCSYKAKAIGGINPKAALLDVMGNCLEMVSPHAVFWGGGHRFMIKPQLYPFRDGGWRDSFMEKLYDGKILGQDGAIASILEGIERVGDDGSGGGFNADVAKNAFKQIMGAGAGLLGGAIQGLSNIFGQAGVSLFNGLSDKLFNLGSDLTGQNVNDVKNEGTSMAKNFVNNLKSMWNNRMIASTIMPNVNVGGNILVGEPTGEWHLTVGNPLNPIMVIGNLICKSAKFTWDEEIGPDDFPTGFSVEYTIDHAMARDSDAIQSMFNRGMGKFYTLPDYMVTSSERVTYVDKHTKNIGKDAPNQIKEIPYMNSGEILTSEFGYSNDGKLTKSNYESDNYNRYDQVYRIGTGSTLNNSGNYNTALLTKFNPINTEAQRSISARRQGGDAGIIARVKSLAATRKMVGN